MTRNIHSVGHAGGTRAPLTWARKCDPNRIGVRPTPNAVPHRAPRRERKGSTSAECCGSLGLRNVRGTEGHGSPRASVRVHGRAS